jgi:hypothetical protein
MLAWAHCPPGKGLGLRPAIQVRIDLRIGRERQVHDGPGVRETRMRKRLFTRQSFSHNGFVLERKCSIDGGDDQATTSRAWSYMTAESQMIGWSTLTERTKNDVQPALLRFFRFMERRKTDTECAAVVVRGAPHNAANLPMAMRALDCAGLAIPIKRQRPVGVLSIHERIPIMTDLRSKPAKGGRGDASEIELLEVHCLTVA